jgi:hypothetical protein
VVRPLVCVCRSQVCHLHHVKFHKRMAKDVSLTQMRSGVMGNLLRMNSVVTLGVRKPGFRTPVAATIELRV